MKKINDEFARMLQDPKNAEVIWGEFIKFTLKMSGKVFKTMFEHEQFLPIYAKFLYRCYQEFIEAGFSDDQAFELVKIITSMMPPVLRV